LLVSAAQLAAQVTTPITPTPTPISIVPQILSTAILGFASSQTAELNVVNLVPAATTTLPVCEVQLAFYDAQNRLLKQGAATNVGPFASTSLSLGRGDLPSSSASALRVSIRGQVSTVLTPTTTGTSSTTAAGLNTCSLVVSLELYDNVTGVTQLFTTDTRSVYSGPVPVFALPAAR
jgi:hypothetical protein